MTNLLQNRLEINFFSLPLISKPFVETWIVFIQFGGLELNSYYILVTSTLNSISFRNLIFISINNLQERKYKFEL